MKHVVIDNTMLIVKDGTRSKQCVKILKKAVNPVIKGRIPYTLYLCPHCEEWHMMHDIMPMLYAIPN